MKKITLILGAMTPIAGLTTILPVVACNKKEQNKIIPIPIDQYIIENGIIKGLKQPWEAYKKYTQILIPANVYSIAEDALASNDKNGQIPKSIKYLKFEESESYRDEQLVINDRAFSGDKTIKQIYFPKRTQYIGEAAFEGCSNVTKLDFSSWDDERATGINPFANFNIFNEWKQEGNIICKNDTIRDTLFYMLTPLGLSEDWFTNISRVQKEVTDENNVKINYDIVNNEYAVITGIEYEGPTVLNEWTMPRALPANNTNLDVLGIAPAATHIVLKNIKKIVIISSPIKSIGAGAFAFSSGLEEVDLKNSNVELIDSNAFFNCRDLKKISFPTELRSIGSYCFYNDMSLDSIDLSSCKNFTKIMPGTFFNCPSLKEFKYHSIDWIGSYAFALSVFSPSSGFTSALPIKGAEYIGDNAFENQGISSIDWGGLTTTKYLGDFAFKGCENMTLIQMGSSNMEYFGAGAISHMPKLTTISGNVIGPHYEVGHNIVYYKEEDPDFPTKIVATCSGSDISKLTADHIKEISPYAFAGINLGTTLSNTLDLSSFSSLTTIGKYAFAELVGSQGDTPAQITIKLPVTVTTIGDYAFAGSNVSDTKFLFGLPALTSWGTYMFSNCQFITKYMTQKEDAIPEGTFADCTQINQLSITPRVKYIGDKAFYNNTSINRIMLSQFTSVPTTWYHEGEKPFNLALTTEKQLTVVIKEGLKESWASLLSQLGITEQIEGGINWSEVQ